MIRLRTTFWALLLLMTAGWAAPAHAQFDFGSEKIIKVADLPDTEEYQLAEGGRSVDVGAVYKQVRILFIPLFNYDVKWAGYVGNDREFLPMDEAELRALATKAGANMPESISLPFWDAWGGKLVVLGILALIGLAFWSARRKRYSH